MKRLEDMRVFAAVAARSSLTDAARELGTTKQTVSRRLAALEASLGVSLVRRTTRRLTLTDVGRAYATRCAEIVRLAHEANAAAASQLDVVAGTLRVTADPVLNEHLVRDVVLRYGKRHPQVRVDLFLTTRKVDLLEERIDVAFRVGPPPDVLHLSARRLARAHLWTVASPSYLADCGIPRTLADLGSHRCLAALPTASPSAWPLSVDGTVRLVPIEPVLRANDVATVHAAALAGLGIAQLPAFLARADVEQKRLEPVLVAHAPEVGGLHVVFPHTHQLAPKVTEFVALAVDVAATSDPFQPRPGHATRG